MGLGSLHRSDGEWTMTALKWLLAFAMMLVNGYLQIKYAKANYPAMRRWKMLLFLGGFFSGALVGWALIPVSGWREFLLAACVFGLPIGYVFLKWFPINVQNVYPKHHNIEENHSQVSNSEK